MGEQDDPINPRDAVDDRMALADRFGLSLGFHACDQDAYLAMISGYAQAYGLEFDPEDALLWATAARQPLGAHRLALCRRTGRPRGQGALAGFQSTPTASASVAKPSRLSSVFSPRLIFAASPGPSYTNAEYTCTSDAPARMRA